jgi:hypothetical protein
LSIDGYWATIKALGLLPTKVPNVFAAADGEKYNVQDPAKMPGHVRIETIHRFKTLLGIS